MSARALALPALVAAVVTVPAVPTPGSGQTSAAERLRFSAGALAGLPADFYSGAIRYQGQARGGDGTDITTRSTDWTETIDAYTEYWGSVEYAVSDELLLAFRARLGTASSTGHYEADGAGAQDLSRELSWLAGDFLFGFRVGSGDLVGLKIYGGPSLGRYTLDTGGLGRDRIADIVGAPFGVEAPDPMTWSSPSWVNLDGVLGARAELNLHPSLSLSAGLEQRILRTAGSAFESSIREDVDAAVGHDPAATLDSYSSWAPALSVGVTWSPGGRGRSGRPSPAVGPAADAPAAPAPRPVGEALTLDPDLPEPVLDAVERGDTAGAVAHLREAVAADPPDPLLHGTLGVLLLRTAPDRETEYEERMEAGEALKKAAALDPDDYRWYFGLGLLRREQGIRNDAERMFRRALGVARDADREIPAATLAELHAEWGELLEEEVLDFRNLITPADHIPATHVDCGAGGDSRGAFCRNFAEPEAFHERLFRVPPAEGLGEEKARRMVEHFREAFRLDPSVPAAARGLLGHLAREGAWEDYVETARAHAEARPGSGWAWIYVGTGLQRTGDFSGANRAFAAGLRRLPAGERAVLESIGEIVAEDDAARITEGGEAYAELLWTRSDPFYLTDENERRLEHYARTALAELWFGEPRRGVRGYETARGVILVRYGEPESIRRIRRDETAARAASDAAAPGGAHVDPPVEYGGRWIFWTYREDLPSFIFQKHLAARTVQHALLTESVAFTEDLRASLPSEYSVPGAEPLAHQSVRFRGTRSAAEVDVYASLPRDTASPPRTGRAGLYFLPLRAGADAEGLESEVRFGPGTRMAVFRVPLEEARYDYSVEAMSRDRGLLARARGAVGFEGFALEGPGISDLLLANQIVPRERGDAVEGRRDLRIGGAGDLRFRAGSPLALYFEVYGLEGVAGGEGLPPAATYRVTVRVTDDEDRGVLGRMIGRIADLLGGSAEGTEISWERTVESPGAAAPEWFTLTLPDVEPGAYAVEVAVEHPGADEPLARTATFVVAGPDGG